MRRGCPRRPPASHPVATRVRRRTRPRGAHAIVAPLTGALGQRTAPRHRGLVAAAALRHRRVRQLPRPPAPGWASARSAAPLTVPLSTIALDSLPVERSGIASGMFNTARETGGALGTNYLPAVPPPRGPLS